MITVTDCIYSI